jgi:hypothetical protein
MTSGDDKIVIGKVLDTLHTLIADLELEIGEEGSSFSEALASAQQALKDAVGRLEMLRAA